MKPNEETATSNNSKKDKKKDTHTFERVNK